jgi:hypothetical protein
MEHRGSDGGKQTNRGRVGENLRLLLGRCGKRASEGAEVGD